MKHKKNNSNVITVMQDIIDNLNDKNRILTERIECLEEQLNVAYGVNAGLQDEQKYKNLVQLHTLLMVLLNLVAPHCDSSPLGQSVGLAIKKYLMTIAKNLATGTLFIREEDKEDWKEDDDEEYGEEEF